jgi:signal transduction histidine kinase
VAEEKRLKFSVELDPALPPSVRTDDMRLRQVLRNLLSNALKFTEKGGVTLNIFRAGKPEWSVDNDTLNSATGVIGFSVVDTGIGIPADKHKIVFEAFQQADGGTSRRYGGTGLGLAISREIAGLLGGELQLHSEAGVGSTLTLFIPMEYASRARVSDSVTPDRA